MKAPDKIYIFQDGDISWCKPEEWEIPPTDRVEYIRADLAELTWEDIRQLFRIADNYESELNRPKYLSEGYCKEILRRFLENKRIKK